METFPLVIPIRIVRCRMLLGVRPLQVRGNGGSRKSLELCGRSTRQIKISVVSISTDSTGSRSCSAVLTFSNFQNAALQCLAAYVRNVSDTKRSYALLSSSNMVMLDVMKVSRPAPLSKRSCLLVLIAREICISPPLLPQAPFSARCTHRRLLPLLPPPAPCQTQRRSFN